MHICTKISPVSRPVMAWAETRLSLQPIHKCRGDCDLDERSKKSGPRSWTHFRLPSKISANWGSSSTLNLPLSSNSPPLLRRVCVILRETSRTTRLARNAIWCIEWGVLNHRLISDNLTYYAPVLTICWRWHCSKLWRMSNSVNYKKLRYNSDI